MDGSPCIYVQPDEVTNMLMEHPHFTARVLDGFTGFDEDEIENWICETVMFAGRSRGKVAAILRLLAAQLEDE